MYGHYVAAVIRRAFQPTARFTDVLQILAASAAPAIARFVGIAVPPPDETLAYIGAVALAFVFLRLFFVAPYQVWREQVGEIGTLKLELSKPERIEIERMAKIRAKKRLQLAAALREAQVHVFLEDKNTRELTKRQREIARLAALVPLEANALKAVGAFQNLVQEVHDDHKKDIQRNEGDRLAAMVAALCAHLHGRITDEDLALQLLQDTESETQR